jgi:hypothetical protein
MAIKKGPTKVPPLELPARSAKAQGPDRSRYAVGPIDNEIPRGMKSANPRAYCPAGLMLNSQWLAYIMNSWEIPGIAAGTGGRFVPPREETSPRSSFLPRFRAGLGPR